MKTRASLYLNIASLLIILASFDVGTAIAYLLIAGEIPSLHVKLSANTMLTIYAVLFVVIGAYTIRSRIKVAHLVREQVKLKQLPKRRFQQTA